MRPHVDRGRLTALALAAAYVFALVASWRHLAGAFATLEYAGEWFVGAGAAVAVDLGLAALALAVASEARRGRPTRRLWLAVALFAGISALANLDHALTVALGHVPTWADVTGGQLDRLTLARAVVFSAALPLLVMVLAHVVDRLAAEHAAAMPVGAHAAAPDTPTGGTPTRPRKAPMGGSNGTGRARLGEVPPTGAERAAVIAAVSQAPTATWPELAAHVGRPRSTVQRWARAMLDAGELAGKPGAWALPASVGAHGGEVQS